ncbi:MAG: hypothetical protein R3C31_13310, partial [Hyphomonadaceae bacterium]
MLRLCVAICLYFLISAGLAHAQTVTLRPRIEANGSAVTMGEVFEGVPSEIAGRALSPAPQPGQVGSLQISMLVAAASAAGLDFTPPPGVRTVQMIRPGGARATIPATYDGRTVADAAIRRGDMVSLVYEAPGLSLSMRARA